MSRLTAQEPLCISHGILERQLWACGTRLIEILGNRAGEYVLEHLRAYQLMGDPHSLKVWLIIAQRLERHYLAIIEVSETQTFGVLPTRSI